MSEPSTTQTATDSAPPSHMAAGHGGPPPFSFGSFVVGITVGLVVGLVGGAAAGPLLEPYVRSGSGPVTIESANPPGGVKAPPLTPEQRAAIDARIANEGAPPAPAPATDPATDPKPADAPAPTAPKAPEPEKAPEKAPPGKQP